MSNLDLESPRPSDGEGTLTAPRTLDLFRPGEQGVIVEIQDHPGASRLMAMGFAPGSEVDVIRRAPLGDPIEYAVRGARVCLRRSQASQIHARPR